MADEGDLLDAGISLLEGHGESDGGRNPAGREFPLHIVTATQQCTRIIYTTKIEWLVRLTDGLTEVPADIAILWKYGPLGAEHRAIVQAVVQSLNAPIHFVGDLDPLDLVTYATLRHPDGSWPAAPSHFGISDVWLEQCERDLLSRPGASIQDVCIAMEREEQDALERLRRVASAWSPVGPRASSLLASGLKLELEGASNPDLYSRAFRDQLVGSLFR